MIHQLNSVSESVESSQRQGPASGIGILKSGSASQNWCQGRVLISVMDQRHRSASWISVWTVGMVGMVRMVGGCSDGREGWNGLAGWAPNEYISLSNQLMNRRSSPWPASRHQGSSLFRFVLQHRLYPGLFRTCLRFVWGMFWVCLGSFSALLSIWLGLFRVCLGFVMWIYGVIEYGEDIFIFNL